MNIFSWLKPKSATVLPEPAIPKVPSGKSQVIPTYLGKTKGAKVTNSSSNTTNLILQDHVRNEATLNQVVKKLVLSSPDLSHAVKAKIETCISDKYTAIAYDNEGILDEEGTRLVQSLLTRINFSSYDYTRYTTTTDLRSLMSSCLYDSMRYGGMGIELVLGETRLPAYFKPLPIRLIEWSDATPEVAPVYKGPDGKEVILNYPTIFYSSSLQDQESPYTDSPLQSAIQFCLWDHEFTMELRKAATKNILQRLRVTINSEKYLSTLPLETQTDKTKLKEAMDATVADIENKLSDLQPEDCLVLFDILEADTIADANRSEDRSIEVLQALINGKISSGAKILPAIIGRGESANSASTEAMLFVKAISAMQHEWNTMFSRALTLAARLVGHDVYVSFKMQAINLRPELELESFRSIMIANELQLLSLGMNPDMETVLKLTGSLPPKGYKPLSGTMFYAKPASAEDSNDYSNTSVSSNGKPDSTKSQKDSETKK